MNKLIRILLISLFLMPSVNIYAETRSSNFVNNKTDYAPVYTVTPDKGEAVSDSNYGNTIKRVSSTSDKSASTSSYLQSSGSTGWSTENCDGTMVIVHGADSTSAIVYDITTETPTFITELKDDNNAIGYGNEIGHSNDIRWDTSTTAGVCDNPKRVYFVGNAIVRGEGDLFYQIDDVTTQDTTRSILHDFSGDFTGAGRVTTYDWGDPYWVYIDTEGMPSKDSRYWAFIVRDGGSPYYTEAVIVYDKTLDSIVGVLEASDLGKAAGTYLPRPNTVMMSPDGTKVITHFERSYVGGTTASYDDTWIDGPHAFSRTFDLTTYATGTVTVTNGNATVEGSGVDWSGVSAGEYFQVKVGDYDTDYTNLQFRWYEIDSVTDGDTLVLTETFKGTTGGSKTYNIMANPVAHMAPGWSHFGWGCDKSGNAVYVFQNDRNDYDMFSDMYGVWTNIIYEPTEFGAYPGVHFGNIYDCTNKKGWCLYDTYGATESGAWYRNQIMFYELTSSGSPDKWRVTHKYGYDAGRDDYDEEHSNLSFNGNAIYWGTFWNNQFDNVTANHMEVVRTLLPTNWYCAALTTQANCEESSSCVWGTECDVVEGGGTPTCGDSTVDAGEECDDGNNTNGDGCDEFCQYEADVGIGIGISGCNMSGVNIR